MIYQESPSPTEPETPSTNSAESSAPVTSNETPAAEVESPKFNPLKAADTLTPEEFSEKYFQEKKTGEEIRKLVQKLHDKRKHEHVIATLRTAILAGQPEPWMYEVLALSMDIAGHPKQEVERILLSMTDFNVRDVPNLLGSAAYLVRLGALAQGLKLYQQATRLEPSRPEPYLLGMRLANQLKDVEAVLWATTGVLTYYWYEDYEKQHSAAIKLLGEWQLRLNKAGDTAQAEKLEEALKEAQQRDLQLKLTWSGEADLDLIVKEPLGTTCSFSNRRTEGGGALLHDGAGPQQSECYEEYVCAFAAPGHYLVTVSHSSGKIVGNRARLEVTRYAGTEQEQTETVNVMFDQKEKKYRISLHQGRRTQKSPVFEPARQPSSQKQQQTRQLFQQWQQQMRVSQAPNAVLPQQANPAIGAVGYAPVVAPVTSGTQLSATATVSADRRYVRIGLQPSVSETTDVFTFTFLQNR